MATATVAETELTQAAEALRRYQSDPVGFMVDVLDVEDGHVWQKMCELAGAVRDHDRVAAKAAHSVSKTYTAARLALWFLLCHYPSTVITTAPSHTQVEEVLWREIRRAFEGAQCKLPGKLTRTRLDLGSKHFALGFSTSPDTVTAEATRFQGLHNDNLLVIFDEAAGIVPQIWRAAASLLGSSSGINHRQKWLCIGNPTTQLGEFAQCFEANSGWYTLTIATTDTPNFKAGEQIIPGLSGREFAKRYEDRYGLGSNQYKVRVLGEFPEYTEGTYYGAELARARREGRIGHYPYDPAFPVYRFADLGDMYTAAIDAQFIRGRIRIIGDYWDNQGQGAQAFVLSMQCKAWVWGSPHYAGPDLDGSNRKSFQTGRTTKDVLAGLGMDFQAVEKHQFADGIEAVRIVWPLLDIDARGAPTLLQAGEGYRKRKNEALSSDDQPVYHDQPLPSWECHMMDALRHLAMAFRYHTIGGQYIGDSRAAAAYHQHGGGSAYGNWRRFNRGRS